MGLPSEDLRVPQYEDLDDHQRMMHDRLMRADMHSWPEGLKAFLLAPTVPRGESLEVRVAQWVYFATAS